MKIKRFIMLLLVAAITLGAFTSCADKSKDVTYSEQGLTVTLPKSMRRSNDTVYEFYFSSPDSVFTAKKLDSEFMKSIELSESITAKEYADAYIEENYLDKTRIDYKSDSDRGIYSFKYNNSEVGEELFHYVTILGTPGAIWFVEMCCENSKSSIYADTFDIWQSSLSTY